MPPCALDEKEDDQDAPDGAVDDEDPPEDGAEPPPAKKQRGNRCDQLTRQVSEMENKLHQEQEKVRLAEDSAPSPPHHLQSTRAHSDSGLSAIGWSLHRREQARLGSPSAAPP